MKNANEQKKKKKRPDLKKMKFYENLRKENNKYIKYRFSPSFELAPFVNRFIRGT